MIDTDLSYSRGDQMVSHKRALAIASGFVVGGFLFFRLHGPVGFTLLQLSYQAALLMCGIGLGGVFPTARLWGPLGMSLAPLPILYLLLGSNPDPESLGFALILFLLAFPAPLVGGAISLLLRRKHIPQVFYVTVLASTLAAGAMAPGIVRRYEAETRHRHEADEITGLLRGIFEAEMFYRAGRPDSDFTCDGSKLAGMSDLGWRSMALYPKIESNETQNFAESVGARWTRANNYAFNHGIHLLLACPDEVGPRGFRAFAFSSFAPAPKFSIDETGKLTVSGDSQGQPAAPGTK